MFSLLRLLVVMLAVMLAVVNPGRADLEVLPGADTVVIPGTTLPYLLIQHDDNYPDGETWHSAFNTSSAGQELQESTFSGGNTDGSTTYNTLKITTTTEEELPIPEPLIHHWHRGHDLLPQGYINRHHVVSPRNNGVSYFPNLRGIPRLSLPYNPPNVGQRQINRFPNQDYTNHASSYIQNQKVNQQSLTPIAPAMNTRVTNSLAQNPFSPLHNNPHPIPNTEPFPKPPNIHQQLGRQDLQLDKFRVLSSNQHQPYKSDPGTELSIHDLTSIFYKENKTPLHSSVFHALPNHNTDGINNRVNKAVNNIHTKNYRTPISSETPLSLNSNNRRQSESTYARTPLKPYYPAITRDKTLYSSIQRSHLHYPPSVSYGEPYFSRGPLIARQHDHEHYFNKITHYKPNIYNRNNQLSMQIDKNIYQARPNTRQFSQSQNFNDLLHQNMNHNSLKSIARLNYAKLPSGYESPTSTFEVLVNKEQESIHNHTLSTRSLEKTERHNFPTRFNGHSGPFVMN
nr:uncharacterized protein LOC128702860 [Cherax quadricarinatus]